MPAAAPPAADPAPAPAPAPPAPTAVAADPDPAPPPAETAPAALVRPAPCEERKIQVSVTRATGEGSYILRLSCSNQTFAVSSDRARPDGKELTNVFKVTPREWETAWRQIEDLRWRTFDDACASSERHVGQSSGPVYRVEIQDGNDRRTFHCAGTRAFTDPLDRLHAGLLALAPAPSGATTSAADRIGVPQCDAFLDAYQRCVDKKVPASEQPELQTALADTRVRLHDALVADPSSGPGLVKTCKDLAREATTATKKYGCSF
jgi:hypothetical protein